MGAEILVREAQGADLPRLLELEAASFRTDRLSRRAMRHWLSREHRVFLVGVVDGRVSGYILVLHNPGTRLGRVYSLAVSAEQRGLGLGGTLLAAGEHQAAEHGCIDLRLEVARSNTAAIALYRSRGYVEFGVHPDYYEDHDDALRMQKRIRYPRAHTHKLELPWVPQQTEFTCGPAALMMALAYLRSDYAPSFAEELRLWREATTIFMTSGHGGCHPLGLALAAHQRGVRVRVWLNRSDALFVDGVRSERKKRVISEVDADYRARASAAGISVVTNAISLGEIVEACDAGCVVLLLVSTWTFDRKRAPHWVAVSGHDEHCLYLHDPDPGPDQLPLDCQYMPIARAEVERIHRFGRDRLQTALVLGPAATNHQEVPCAAR